MTDNWFEPENICHDIVSPKFYGKINYSSNDAQDLWQKNMTQAIMKIQVAENDVLIWDIVLGDKNWHLWASF